MTYPSLMDRIGPAWRAATGAEMSRRRFKHRANRLRYHAALRVSVQLHLD